MRNQRPRLGREPVFADEVAEVVRAVADIMGVRVSVRVILYKHCRDLVTVRAPSKFCHTLKKGIECALLQNNALERVTFAPWKMGVDVWILITEEN